MIDFVVYARYTYAMADVRGFGALRHLDRHGTSRTPRLIPHHNTTPACRSLRLAVLVLQICAFLLEPPAPIRAQTLPPYVRFMPFVATATASACQPIPGATYTAIYVPPPPTDRPAALHADLNLALRGDRPTTGYLGLVDYAGAFDPRAPQLPGLFADQRTGTFRALHQVYDWNWVCNCRGSPLTTPSVTLVELATTPGETLHVPQSGYTIGSSLAWGDAPTDDYAVLVLYATANRLTLKYTRTDNVVHGYTLHLENLCVEPRLLALYEQWNTAGRGHLPALHAGQALGRARDGTVGVAIRDSGTFLDPRSRKDWWQGR